MAALMSTQQQTQKRAHYIYSPSLLECFATLGSRCTGHWLPQQRLDVAGPEGEDRQEKGHQGTLSSFSLSSSNVSTVMPGQALGSLTPGKT